MVSYIFTYRQSTNDRFQNLLATLNWLQIVNVPNLEVVIIEQDSEPKLQLPANYSFPIRIIFAYNPGLFNRSWGFNLGIKNTSNQILFFADSDMVVDPALIHQTVNLIQTNQYDAISPFLTCHDLLQEECQSLDFTNFDYTLDRQVRGGMNFCSGIVAFSRMGLIRIYNWDERFEGWGGEDDIQFMKTRQILKHITLNGKCFHMYHSRSKNDGTNQHDNYRNNLQLFWHYARNQAAILNDMKNYPNWGDSNKYRK